MMKARMWAISAALAVATALSGAAQAQIRTIDPNQAGDLAPVPASEAEYGTKLAAPRPAPASAPDAAAAPAADGASADEGAAPATDGATAADSVSAQGAMPRPVATQGAQTPAAGGTYAQDDVLAAAEGVFGKGAEGLAKLVQKIFAEQGQPNAYIAGREAGGAIIVGVRYGSGTLFHKVEGQLPIYWTGPSLGFDFGANGAKSFVLVYNLFDTADIFKRYPAVEGSAYVVGGFTATYLRRGDVVLIPIRLGVGWRLGVNVGYMNFTRQSKAVPF